MTSSDRGAPDRSNQRRQVILGCNSPHIGDMLRDRLDPYISLIVVPEIHRSSDIPIEYTALVIDAALLAPDEFRPFVRALRSWHTAGHYMPVLLLTTPRTAVSPRGAFMSGISGILEHPVSGESLLDEAIRLCDTSRWWRELEDDPFLTRETDICLSFFRGQPPPEGARLRDSFHAVDPRCLYRFRLPPDGGVPVNGCTTRAPDIPSSVVTLQDRFRTGSPPFADSRHGI